ncbi:Integral membrane protein [Devosia sp. DBB001]|nr:Integral membrane protein [Devosia sp. DBB001]
MTQSIAAPRLARRDTILAHLAMLAFAAMIAGSFTAGALAVPYIEPVPLNALRFLLATLIMGVVAFGVVREPARLPRAPWRMVVLGALNAVYFVTMFIALTMTAPVATSAVFTLIPLMAAAIAYFILKQRVGPTVLLSLVLAGLGSIWVIFRGDLAAIAGFDIGKGELIYLVGCICYAFHAPLVRHLNRGESALLSSFWTLAAATICIALFGLGDIVSTDWLHLPSIVWWALAYLAIFSTAISFFCLQYASLRLPASKVLAYGYLTPVFVIIYEGLLGHGWASLSVAGGAVVIVLGLLVLALTPDHR